MQRKRTSKKATPATQLHKGSKGKPSTDSENEPERVPHTAGALAESALRAVDGASLITGMYTHLPPPKQANSVLTRTIAQVPGLYSEMIGQIMTGSSLKSASTLIGVSYHALYLWLREGADDYAVGNDTYYSRLFNDVRRATAFCAGQCERELAATDPLKWLERGPGKQFHADSGLWQPPAKQLAHDPSQDDNPLDPLPLVDATQDSTDPADSVMGDAVKHLEALNISTSPEFAKQLREQYRLPAANEQTDRPTPQD